MQVDNGLERVVAAETVLSEVDGAAGRLVIRGAPVEALAGRVSFEAVTHRLFDGFFPELPDPRALAARLGTARSQVFERLGSTDSNLSELPIFEAMRALTARLADGRDLDTALRLVAAPAVFACTAACRRRGDAAMAPDPSLNHAADVLRMLRGGETPDRAEADALDAYLVTVCDHGLNASTFAARVAASTQADLTSSVLAGMSALYGPLHGGAPGPVLDMLDAIAAPDNAEAWLDRAVARGERLMGFGHRVYRVRDPRADALKAAVKRLAAARGRSPGRLAFAEAVEAAALQVLRRRKPDRSLDTNVEFYTALLLEALGFPREAFTTVFAMGRVAGWIAHAREQAQTGRLIRPQSRYIGPAVGLAA